MNDFHREQRVVRTFHVFVERFSMGQQIIPLHLNYYYIFLYLRGCDVSVHHKSGTD